MSQKIKAPSFHSGKQFLLFLIISLFFCLPIIIPYLNKGYFLTHDGEWAVVRAGEMFRELRDLQIPPRYSGALNYGYGYPLFNFVYPSPYYLTTVLHFVGLGFISSVKTLFALSIFFSFAGMFLLSRKFWKNNLAGLISAVLYIYLPYHLVDLFVRGSLGESVSFAIYPFIIYFSLFILRNEKRSLSIFINSILVALLITTHNISAVYFGIIYLAFILSILFTKEKKSVLFLLPSIIWGALISFYFWGAAIFEKGNILLSIVPIADRNLYFVNLSKLIYSPWGYGTPTALDPFTYSLGIPQVIAFLISFFAAIRLKDKLEKNISVSFFILSIIFIFMMFPVSSVLWKLPFLSEINYPWTLLLPVGFLICFLSGGIIKNIKYGQYLGIIILISTLVLYLPFAKPSSYIYKDDNFYLTNEATTTSSNELMPLWVKKQPTQRFEDKIEGAKVNNLVYMSNKISFSTNLNSEKQIIVNQIYYPGWKAFVNGSKSEIFYNSKLGVIRIDLPTGSSSVLLKFAETPFRLFADIVSLISLVGLILFFFYSIIKE